MELNLSPSQKKQLQTLSAKGTISIHAPMRGATAKITYLPTNMIFYLCNITKKLKLS